MNSYIDRTLQRSVAEASESFPVVFLSGPRQVGKTTLLEEVQKGTRSYVTLDDLNVRSVASADPAGFLQRLKLPVLIEEVQYVPELFPYIKITVDKLKKPGLFWLTGSQQFHLMKNIHESLAGRVAILRLQGISLAEEEGRAESTPFLPDFETIKAREKTARALTIPEIYFKIWRGTYPAVVLSKGKNWERFFESYVTTYIQKDVREFLQISDQGSFLKFMQILATRTGQMLNYSDLGRDVGLSQPTIKSWLSVLHASGIIFLLEPYFNNRAKRLIKTPKLYFMDTGLCSYLSGWLNPDVLERGAASGPMLETYVVSEIIKSYLHNGRTPRIYFYRDKEKREIDLLIEENGLIYPIEIKKTASIRSNLTYGFDFLRNLKMPIGKGALICFINSPLPISSNFEAIPVGYI